MKEKTATKNIKIHKFIKRPKEGDIVKVYCKPVIYGRVKDVVLKEYYPEKGVKNLRECLVLELINEVDLIDCDYCLDLCRVII